MRTVFAFLLTAVNKVKVYIVVKIDTRQKFHVITLNSPDIAAIMTAELKKRLLPLLKSDVKNVVLSLKDNHSIDQAAIKDILTLQQHFYQNDASFIICDLQKPVEEFIKQTGILSLLNVTPTQSEASDIVQMEEIEREMGF